MDGDQIFQMVALERTLFVEGRSRDRKVGEFAGVVLALGWWSRAEEPAPRAWVDSPPPPVMYLVSDRRKPSPVWISAGEIANQDWISAIAANGVVSPDQPTTERESRSPS
jgi:hypothetical protein